jgi:methionyl aminopeptidase
VSNGKPSNIFRILRERPLKDQGALDLLRLIKQDFGTLPFAERWCATLDPKAPSHLKTLVRHGLIFSYPMLIETGSGMVSQAEHTVIIHGQKCEITT